MFRNPAMVAFLHCLRADFKIPCRQAIQSRQEDVFLTVQKVCTSEFSCLPSLFLPQKVIDRLKELKTIAVGLDAWEDAVWPMTAWQARLFGRLAGCSRFTGGHADGAAVVARKCVKRLVLFGRGAVGHQVGRLDVDR